MKDEIRAQFLPAFQRRATPLAAQDASIRTDPRTIIVAIPPWPLGCLPDEGLRAALLALLADYPRLLLVFALPPADADRPDEPLPDWLDPIDPPLSPTVECAAFLAEGRLNNHIAEVFGSA